MGDVQDGADLFQIVLRNDDNTPDDFVLEVLCLVLKRPYADAVKLIDAIEKHGHAICGTHPRRIATRMLKAARQRIDAAGHRLVVTSEAVATGTETPDGTCKLCDAFSNENRLTLRGVPTLVCDDCTGEVTNSLSDVTRTRQFSHACDALNWHFAGIPRDQLVATTRQFPGHMRADVQVAIDRLFSTSPLRFFGIYEQHRYETLTFAGLTRDGRDAQAIAPAQYHDVDVGEAAPVKCLNNGLWLCRDDELRYAVVLSSHREYGFESGTRIEIAVPVGAAGAQFVQRCFSELENAVSEARSYRGKILSLDRDNEYRGRSRGITVHKLPTVERGDVILPEAALKLLDRNVLNFVGNRAQLRRLGQSTRKGILLYGPPGTGKTHTIRYLASNLPGHTTLIITAAQVTLLAEYMSSCPPAAARDGRDRGRRSHCTQSRRHGAMRGIDAQRPSQRDGWIEGECRYPVRPHHQPAGAA